MNTEIERKYTVAGDAWRAQAHRAEAIRQGYFALVDSTTVRVRVVDRRGLLTIKGPTVGISRAEFEYEIPHDDALSMLDLFCAGRQLEKTRHHLEHEGVAWVVDEFEGANAGLVLAEVELERPDSPVERPRWVDQEVSHDRRYRNGYLAGHPWPTWGRS